MKASSLLFILIFIGNTYYTQSYSDRKNASDHLIEVNKEWLKQSDLPSQEISFNSDVDRIAFHLHAVIEDLRTSSIGIDPAAGARRDELLDVLAIYADAKQFPKNIHHSERTPYFIDHEGTACAVGHLMRSSGSDELAERIRSQHNYDLIKDIRTQGVFVWAQKNGFTLDELAWIQPTYAPETPWCTVSEGVNGSIHIMSYTYNKVYLSGSFDSINGIEPCSAGLAYIENDVLYCVDDRPNGSINDIQRAGTYGVVLAGQFSDGIIAEQIDNEWTLYAIPSRPNGIGLKILRSFFADKRFLVAIDPQDGTGNSEIWRYDSDENSWTLLITTFGPILSHNSWAFGGAFEGYIDHLDNQTAIETNNLLEVNLSSSLSFTSTPFISSFIPDSVLCISYSGSIMYVGGTGDDQYPNAVLSRYQGGSFQQLLYFTEPGSYSPSVFDLEVTDEYNIIYACNFNTGDALHFGFGLGAYNPLNGGVTSMAYANGPVHHIVNSFDDIYIGGPFTTMHGLTEYNGLAKICSPNSVDELTIPVSVYPNPTSDFIQLESVERIESLKIFDNAMRLIEGAEITEKKIDLSSYPNGTYYLHITTSSGTFPVKVVKI